MQKEIYNYTFIQQQIKRKKELAEAQAARTKEEGKFTLLFRLLFFHFKDENMVPAIFQQMEQVEDSDGFDSCEDEQIDSSKRSGNPFLDFN